MTSAKRNRIEGNIPRKSLQNIFSFLPQIYRSYRNHEPNTVRSENKENDIVVTNSDSLPSELQDIENSNIDPNTPGALRLVSKSFQEELDKLLTQDFVIENQELKEQDVNSLIEKWNNHYSIALKLHEVRISSPLLTRICSKCKNMFSLELFACSIDDVIHIESDSPIKSIFLSNMNNIFLKLQGANITALRCENISFGECVFDCPKLVELSLSACSVDDDGIFKMLSQVQHRSKDSNIGYGITKLTLNECNNLRMPCLTSATLTHLRLNRNNGLTTPKIECENLEYLEMKWCDNLTSFLIGSNSLKLLDVTGSCRRVMSTTSPDIVVSKILSSIHEKYGESCEVVY